MPVSVEQPLVRVLCIGDVFGRPGRKILKQVLPKLIEEKDINFVVANGENLAGGKGLNKKCADELFGAGVDVLTNGNHLMDNKDILPLLQNDARVIRPWNMTDSTPGKGYVVIHKQGVRYGVANFMGTVFMKHNMSPFKNLDKQMENFVRSCDVGMVDLHAEVTSEKKVMGFYLDGKVSVVYGTHTHIPTADHEILDGGTAYITDLGMTGAYDTVIGLKKQTGIDRIVSGVRGKFEVGKGKPRFFALLSTIDPANGKATSVEQIKITAP